ncbi:MAG: toll/interleukin-1 receptor domain-containing protein [Chlorobium sp.]|nr:MAG: toll/interleukin-1 receptor domain-containing protein [Chlorobium sp.]
MQQIFICYRRDDSAYITGRIYDVLKTRYEIQGVFRDLDAIAPGIDYRTYIKKVLGQCHVMLVVIGESWLNILDEHGHSRLFNSDDDVCKEIETALQSGLLIIPVLLGKARMPHKKDLPANIGELASLNAIQIRPDPDFHRDMEQLLNLLPVDHRVAALQSFAFHTQPMLRRIQVGQGELSRFSRETGELINYFKTTCSTKEYVQRLEKISQIMDFMIAAFNYTTIFVNFVCYLDPNIGIGLGNIEEVSKRFQEMKATYQTGNRWADDLINSLRSKPGIPDDLARRVISLVGDLRDQVNLVGSEIAKISTDFK